MCEIPLYSKEEVYRPYWERNSALLEVTEGCSWHKCAFCDFVNDAFGVFSLKEIEEKAKMLAEISRDKNRIFFLGENPFVLRTELLLAICDCVQRQMPWITEISMYARVDDVLAKTDDEIRILRQHKIVHLHIGMESGSDEILSLMNKGVTSAQVIEACRRLKNAGITYSFTMITGLGGRKLTEEHIRGSIALLNQVQPATLWLMGLRIWKDTPLAKMIESGNFVPTTPDERLLETRRLIAGLELEKCYIADTTVLNKYTLIGELPTQKEMLLEQIKNLQKQ